MIMMKKVFLAILPTLMVLSSCGAAPKENKEVFVEDTLAHEEIFGEPVQMVKETVERKPDGIDEFVESGRPSLGVQTATYESKFSIRFVAAVNIAQSDLGATTPVWTRTIFKADGSVAKKAEDFEVETVYTSLKNGESTMSIKDFNDANGTSYDYFAVYTILKIDLASRGDYFVNAYLTIGDKQSKVLATSINQNTQLTFDVNDSGVFGVKKTASGFSSFAKANQNKDGCWASFANVELAEGNSFVLVNRYIEESNRNNDFFAIYGFDKLRAGDTNWDGQHPNGFYEFTQDGSSQFSVCPSDHSYYFYVQNSTNNIQPKYSLSKVIKLDPGVWTSTGNPKIAIEISNTGFGSSAIYTMAKEENSNLYSYQIVNVPDDATLKFLRLNPENNQAWNWSNAESSLNTGNNTYTISGWGDQNAASPGSWGNN